MGHDLQTQVLIVGAGPTGLSLACQLARHGVDFMLVERNAAVTPYSKALGVHARTLEIYDQLDIAQEAVARGRIVGNVRFVANGAVRGEVDLSHLGAGLSAFPYVLILEQSKNEHLLCEWLEAHDRSVHWKTELESFTHDEHSVQATLATPDGPCRVTAQYLVGCDGARSPVREALDLGFAGSTFERLFYVADARVDWPLGHDALHVCFARDSFVLFFPMEGERRFRIVGVFPEAFRKDEGEVLYEEIEARIKTEVEIPLDISDVRWFSVYKVHTRHAAHFRAGRCLIAGDAAHIHSPAGAQGMNTGIQDAYNLAWKLALVLRGEASDVLLDTYDEERLANARRLLRTTDRLFQLAAGQGDVLGFVRTQIIPRFAGFLLDQNVINRRLFPLLSQIGIHYRAGRLSDHEGDEDFAVKAGDRMPYLMVDGVNLYRRLRAPVFHLLTFGEEPAHCGSAAERIQQHRLSLTEQVADIFGTLDEFHVLLRPDHHIAWITHEAPQVRLADYLGHLQRGF